MVIVATESSIDQSAAAVFIHGLMIQPLPGVLRLKKLVMVLLAALDYANSYRKYPDSKVLVIASDIAKYGINTPGELTREWSYCCNVDKRVPVS